MQSPGTQVVYWLHNEIVRRTSRVPVWAARGPRSAYRARALHPGGFDEDYNALADDLVGEWAELGWRLSVFMEFRRLQLDAPHPDATRLGAVRWNIRLAIELVDNRTLMRALEAPEPDWQAYLARLSRTVDQRLERELFPDEHPPLPYSDARARRAP